jgi:hypothetical protein
MHCCIKIRKHHHKIFQHQFQELLMVFGIFTGMSLDELLLEIKPE